VDQRGDLPVGTVTFLFTHIEGSTRLLQRIGDRYPAVLARHHELLRGAFSRYGATEVDTEGDARCRKARRSGEPF
jgi:class 3 adenylate cyclase